MAAIQLEITEGQIRNAIAVAITEAFSAEKKDQIILDVVRAHLQHKENGYDKETLLSKRVGGMIREVAEEMIRQRLQEVRPKIQSALQKWMGPEWEESLLSELSVQLAKLTVNNLRISCTVSSEKGDFAKE